LKVLLIQKADYGWGGGLIAANRLFAGLRKAGVDARVLVREKSGEDSIAIPPSPRLESLIGRITQRIGLNDVHCVSSFNVRKMEAYREADVLDFHTIHNNFFNYLALAGLTKDKPAVFTLHDMWPFTGHCHASRDCERWKTGCGRCPYPETEPAIRRDTSHLEWKLKDWTYRHSNLSIVAPSTWLAGLAKQSLLRRFPVYHIPYGIDTEIYRPHDPRECRSLLGIAPDKKVIFFVVDFLTRYLKGGDLLLKALQSLPSSLKSKVVLMLLGKGGDGLAKNIDLPVINLGYADSDQLKAIFFSAADLFVHPTRADNFPVVLLESMACGTPVVSYRIGGVPDTVHPGVTGYLAEPENADDLAEGILQLVEDDRLRESMGEKCRHLAVKEYRLELQVQRYITLYQQLAQLPEPSGNPQPVLGQILEVPTPSGNQS
jgi:glycosyltransferase involved in cell wall biosynthesis